VQALEGLQGLAVVCKLHGSGTHRCRDKKDHQFIAMEVRARSRSGRCDVADGRLPRAARGVHPRGAAQGERAATLLALNHLRGAPLPAHARGRPARRLTRPARAQVGVRMLDALRALHERGCALPHARHPRRDRAQPRAL
jgi:hypothetical protein